MMPSETLGSWAILKLIRTPPFECHSGMLKKEVHSSFSNASIGSPKGMTDKVFYGNLK
jgi:hypothetical protein